MSSYAGPTVAVKLFIDKEKQKVLFAESDKEFVDVLFSFLTLPLGAIVRVLDKQSGVGCLDEVYKSVESLSTEHFHTEACKTMLLCPHNAAASHYDRLKVKVDCRNIRSIYVCLEPCYDRGFSSVSGSICKSCNSRRLMHLKLPQNDNASVGYNGDGAFVKSGPKLIITDDLQVAPASTGLVFSLLDKFGLNEKADIEEKFLHLDYDKIKSLLRRTLISKEPLTGLYFNTVIKFTPDDVSLDELPANLLPKQESNNAPKFDVINIKLIQTEDNSRALYAEVGQDFVDLIFGLLSVPLGSIMKAYGHWRANGCVDNLYHSVHTSARECIIEDCRSLLLFPKLAPFFGSSINPLQVEESDRKRASCIIGCLKCFKDGGGYKCTCAHNDAMCATITLMNPKSPSGGNASNRAYIKGGLRNFIVTNDLRVLHFSLANTLQVMRSAMIPKEKLVEKDLTLDKAQVLKLLSAATATREVLSSVLLPPKKKRHPHR
ncbi:unnamed protein product [Urochloa decumbens]|uniref:Uncharacterized protein n=1 Tax=Urochloa decumbens TaxID=240449 RepID=A0ABC9D2Y2_9POAL